MNQIDQTAIKDLGIPGILLMEYAAMHVSYKAIELLTEMNGSHAVVVAGSGNNGGDAYAVARQLLLKGYVVSLFCLSPLHALSGDARVNADILQNMGMDMIIIDSEQALERLQTACQGAHLVVDGLFGTGLNRKLDGIVLDIIAIINSHSQCTLSIDLPSGINAKTGEIMGACIHAHHTVTFFLPKTGMVQYPAANHTGSLTVADIGIPYLLADLFPELMTLTDTALVTGMLPKRPANSHKGTFGKVLVMGGSQGMAGAAGLAAKSAYRTGSGLVRLAVIPSILDTLSALVPEAVFTLLEEADGHLGEISDDLLLRIVGDCDAVLLGPGLSQNEGIIQTVAGVINRTDKPLVLDADALNLVARNTDVLSALHSPCVITPHPKEMAALLGCTVEEVQKDRVGVASSFAKKYRLTVLLKGAATVIADEKGRLAVNPTGNSGMATAGSGDVLAGMVVSLLGQGIPAFESAVAGAFLHGMAGDLAAKEMGEASVMASDIIQHIGAAYLKIAE